MANRLTSRRRKDAKFLLDHVAVHGTRGFNVTQKTNAVNDSTTREVIRSLKQRLDALQQVAVVLVADIDGVRHMLSLLDTKLYGEEVRAGEQHADNDSGRSTKMHRRAAKAPTVRGGANLQ